jgi:hypothetical protein
MRIYVTGQMGIAHRYNDVAACLDPWTLASFKHCSSRMMSERTRNKKVFGLRS